MFASLIMLHVEYVMVVSIVQQSDNSGEWMDLIMLVDVQRLDFKTIGNVYCSLFILKLSAL